MVATATRALGFLQALGVWDADQPYSEVSVALQGTLDTFALADVLRLLATTAKTGRLRVEGDRGQGSVWLRDGTVMASSAERAIEGAPSEEVLFELLRFGEGAFDFELDELSPHGEQPEDVEVLLRDANALLSEWKDLEKVVPSLDHQVTLVEALQGDDVTINAEHWPTIVAVGTGRSVGELAAALSLGELGVTRKVRDLIELGVVTLDQPSSEAVARSLEAVPPPDPTTRTAGPRVPARGARSSLRRTGEAPRVEAPRVEAPRVEAPATGGRRGGPFAGHGSGEVLGTPSAARGDTGELERLGWLSDSGSQQVVPDDAAGGNGNGADPLAPPNGAGLTQPGGTADAGAKAPRETKRAGRASKRSANGRSGSKRGATGDDAPAPPVSPVTGTPLLPSTPRLGKGRSGSRRSTTRPPTAPASGGPSATPRAPGAGSPFDATPPGGSPFDAGTTPPARPFDTGGMSVPPLYESGAFASSPLPADTGQIRPVSPSALPPDLHWAADDGRDDGRNGGFGGPANPTPPAAAPLDPGKVAPHVAAMSPEARAAVQGTVGNHGGTNGGPAVGEDLADRGQLINFLSSVRP